MFALIRFSLLSSHNSCIRYLRIIEVLLNQVALSVPHHFGLKLKSALFDALKHNTDGIPPAYGVLSLLQILLESLVIMLANLVNARFIQSLYLLRNRIVSLIHSRSQVLVIESVTPMTKV